MATPHGERIAGTHLVGGDRFWRRHTGASGLGKPGALMWVGAIAFGDAQKRVLSLPGQGLVRKKREKWPRGGGEVVFVVL